MEEHRVSQVKIVEALEEEKRKLSKELEEMQNKRALKANQTPRHSEFYWNDSSHYGSAVELGLYYME